MTTNAIDAAEPASVLCSQGEHMPTDFDKQLWALEWGPNELNGGRYPFHVDLLKNALLRNRETFAGPGVRPPWIILHIGPAKECFDALESLHKWEPRRFGAFA